MVANFTPGPWTVSLGHYVLAPSGAYIADVMDGRSDDDMDEAIATSNAQLIAAAPDQNSALELVLTFLGEEQEVLERSYLPEPDDEEQAGLERIALLIKVVSEALAKADGKQAQS